MAGERETDGRTGKKRAPGAAWPQTLLLCCKIPLRSPPLPPFLRREQQSRSTLTPYTPAAYYSKVSSLSLLDEH